MSPWLVKTSKVSRSIVRANLADMSTNHSPTSSPQPCIRTIAAICRDFSLPAHHVHIRFCITEIQFIFHRICNHRVQNLLRFCDARPFCKLTSLYLRQCSPVTASVISRYHLHLLLDRHIFFFFFFLPCSILFVDVLTPLNWSKPGSRKKRFEVERLCVRDVLEGHSAFRGLRTGLAPLWTTTMICVAYVEVVSCKCGLRLSGSNIPIL